MNAIEMFVKQDAGELIMPVATKIENATRISNWCKPRKRYAFLPRKILVQTIIEILEDGTKTRQEILTELDVKLGEKGGRHIFEILAELSKQGIVSIETKKNLLHAVKAGQPRLIITV